MTRQTTRDARAGAESHDAQSSSVVPDAAQQLGHLRSLAFDPLKVNVEYTPGGSNTPEEFPQADNLQDCGDEDGWYYDDPINPTKVFLCPKSCERVQLDTDANVKILFGCPTRVN